MAVAIPDPVGTGPRLHTVWAGDLVLLRQWTALVDRLPAEMTECYVTIRDAPYPEFATDRRHGPLKDLKEFIGPNGAVWQWLLSGGSYTIWYVRSAAGPLVIYAGARPPA
jgi:hypothetical protein